MDRAGERERADDAPSPAAADPADLHRRGVLDDAEHAIGNVLQRLHHAVRAAAPSMGPHGERAEAGLEELESLLGLLFDYLSPVVAAPRPTEALAVGESLAGQMRALGARIVVGPVPAGKVAADPRLLTRSFQLLGEAVAVQGDAAPEWRLEVLADAPGGMVEYALRTDDPYPPARGRHALAIAVAARLIHLQGGALRQRSADGCPYSVLLARQGD